MMVKIKALWAKITGCTLATIDQAKLDLAQAEAKLKAEVAALAAKIGTEDAVIAAKFKVMEAAGKVEAAKVGTEATTIWAKFAAAPSWLQGVIFLAVLAVPSLLFYQCDKKPQAAAPQVFASIPPISAAAHVPLVEVPVAKGLIQVLEKKALSKKLKLPKVISDDTNAQVVAMSAQGHPRSLLNRRRGLCLRSKAPKRSAPDTALRLDLSQGRKRMFMPSTMC